MEAEVLVSTDKNNLYELTFAAVLSNLSDDASPHVFEVNQKAREEWFRADWSGFAFIQLAENDFSSNYVGAAVYCIHKDDIADIYIIEMYSDKYPTEVERGNFFDVVKDLPDLSFAEQYDNTVTSADENTQDKQTSTTGIDSSPISSTQTQKLLNIIAGPDGKDFTLSPSFLESLGFAEDPMSSACRYVTVCDGEKRFYYQFIVLPNDSGFVIGRKDGNDRRFLRLDSHFNLVSGFEFIGMTQITIPKARAANYWASDLAKLGQLIDELDDD